jgi:non-specific serine/threonine protein kinase
LLSSDKAASGLNLTEASHIVLLDTLNTNKKEAQQIENQAIGRACRIGQTKTVLVNRFIMKDSIEEEFYKQNL